MSVGYWAGTLAGQQDTVLRTQRPRPAIFLVLDCLDLALALGWHAVQVRSGQVRASTCQCGALIDADENIRADNTSSHYYVLCTV